MNATHELRTLPRNLQAEMSVIGSLMFDPDCHDDVAAKLSADAFYDERNRLLYSAFVEMRRDSAPIDAVTLAEHLEAQKKLVEAGGKAYLLQAMEAVPHAAHVQQHADIVVEHWIRRKVIRAAEVAIEQAADLGQDIQEVAERADQELLSVSERMHATGCAEIGDILVEVFDRINAGESKFGLGSGFPSLDALTNGFQPGTLNILAARPGVGKTAFAKDVFLHTLSKGKAGLFISLEQSQQELAQRLLVSQSGVDYGTISNCVREEDRTRILVAAGELQGMKGIIDDTSGMTLAAISSVARVQKRRYDLALVVVDYLQLMMPENRRDPREQQVAAMSRGLKILARQLKIPILCLAQLNRDIEKREKKEPRLSDLRESGAIEQDADTIMFLHRPWLMQSDDGFQKKQSDDTGDSGDPEHAELKLAKHRNGRTGDIKLRWAANLMTFTDASVSAYQPWGRE